MLDDQKRDASLALSFLSADLPATKTVAFPAHVYLSAGDLERAFDKEEFRPDAAIIPTNTDLQITAPAPATQAILIERVKKQADVLRDLEDQIAARRKQSSAASAGEPGLLRIGLDSFIVQLPSPTTRKALSQSCKVGPQTSPPAPRSSEPLQQDRCGCRRLTGDAAGASPRGRWAP